MREKTVTGRGLGVVFMLPTKHTRKKKTTEGIWLKTLKMRFLASQQPQVPKLPCFMQELVKPDIYQES